MRKYSLLLAIAFVGGCSVGQVDGFTPDGGSTSTNDPADIQSFQQMIAPMVTRCTACHGTIQMPNLLSFEALQPRFKKKPAATNPLITKKNAPEVAPTGLHQGLPYFDAAEEATVTTWIDGLVGTY